MNLDGMTVSQIADVLHVHRHQVAYCVGMTPIKASAMRGRTRLFDRAAVERIRKLLTESACIKPVLYTVDGLAAVLDMTADRVRYWCQSPALGIVPRFLLQERGETRPLFTEADRNLIALESSSVAMTTERLDAEVAANREFIKTGVRTLAGKAQESAELRDALDNDGWGAPSEKVSNEDA